MTSIVTIRPPASARATAERGRQLGLAIAAFPLSELRAVEWHGPEPDEIDALLIGSANAIRLGGPELARYVGKPVHAVGETSAAACRAAGLKVASVGEGGLQRVLDDLPPGPLRLLRIAGRDHVPLAPPEGKQIMLRVAYDRVDLPLPEALRQSLQQGATVLLYSAAGAGHLAAECARCGIERSRIRLAALGPRIAEAAGEGWGEVQVAPRANEQALLALVAQMCQ